MTDSSNNHVQTTNSNTMHSLPSSSVNTYIPMSQYTVLAGSDPTKIKLKRKHSSSAMPSSSTPYLYGVPQIVDGNANKVNQTSNGVGRTIPYQTHLQVPLNSPQNQYAGAGTNFQWHTPVPHTFITPLSSASTSNSSLSSCSSNPASATASSSATSSSSAQSQDFNYTIDHTQSSSMAVATHSPTITNQTPSLSTPYPAMNTAAGSGPSSWLYINNNVYPAPTVSSSSASSSTSLSSYRSNAALVNNFFSGQPQNISFGNIYNNSSQPSVNPATATTATTATTPAYLIPQQGHNIPQKKILVKKPRGRPKKDSLLTAYSTAAWVYDAVNAAKKGAKAKKQRTATTTSATSALAFPTTAFTTTTFPTTLTAFPTTSTTFPTTSTAFPTTSTSSHDGIENMSPIVTATTPLPPNWLDNSEDTIMSLLSFKRYSVSPTTAEFETIANMLHPVQINGIEQIVNPDLWKRFVNTRKEMLRSKTEDLNILPKLGLDEREVIRCAHFTLNYTRDPLLIPYSDNMVLLFHCTRNQSNLSNILSQGLDERLSNISGGLLGKGIYFADDPKKSLQYDGTGCILIFAVLLGDCISVDHFPNKNALVREPEKVAQQKRNFNDQFFDSIVARPAGYNEYVIYNRYQCCPLYQVSFQRSSIQSHHQNDFNYATQSLPPIAWIPEGPNYAMPVQKKHSRWPFYAVDLFERMGVTPPKDEDDNDRYLNELTDNTEPNSTAQMSIDEKLATLISLGYHDLDKNKEVLCRFNNDLDQAVNYLLDQDSPDAIGTVQTSQPSTSAAAASEAALLSAETFPSTSRASTIQPSTSSSPKKKHPRLASFSTASKSMVTIDLVDDDSACSDVEEIAAYEEIASSAPCKEEFVAPEIPNDLPEDIAEWALQYEDNYLKTESEATVSPPSSPTMDDCLICYSEYECFERAPSLWKELVCSHKLCLECYANILTTRTTMSGVQHTFVKCPFCQGITGTEVGDCPDLQMNVSLCQQPCDGYEHTNSIRINYFLNTGGYKLNRTAYLPNTTEGQEILKLLRTAFDRRLCFQIGTSVTTGAENVIVWNIHHKTSQRGGVSSYGYPDPTYMDRVKWELKSFGIE